MARVELTLRPLQPPDLSTAVALDQICLGGWWSENSYRDEITRPSSDLLGLFAPSQAHCASAATCSTPVLIGMGCQWTLLDEAHIILLMVHPQFRGQGFGTAMLLGLLAQARERQAACATLEVRAANTAARQLYAKFGFREAGRRRNYYQNPDEDALILWCAQLQRRAFAQQLASWVTANQQRLEQGGWSLPLTVQRI